MIDVIADGERDFHISPIDGTERSKHQMFDLAATTSLQEIDKTGRITVYIVVPEKPNEPS